MRLGVVRQISPFGPIFGKELRVSARRKRTYLLRAVYLAILLLVLTGAYAATDGFRQHEYEGVAARSEHQARLAEVFFGAFTVFGILTMTLIGPVLTSTAISVERKQKTLSVLLMTPITAWQIVAGKLFSRLLVALTLIGLSLPALGVVRLLGGVEAGQMAQVLGLCVVAAVFSAAIGLFFSTFMTRSYAVILLSYATLLGLYWLVPVVLAVTRHAWGLSINIEWVAMVTDPLACASGLWSRGGGPDTFWPCVAFNLIGTALLLASAAAVLRRISRSAGRSGAGESFEDTDPRAYAGAAPLPLPALRVGAPAAPPPALPRAALPGELALPPIAASPAFLSDPFTAVLAIPEIAPLPLRAAPRGNPKRRGGVWDNPVLWRESHQPLFAKKWQAMTGAIITLLLLAISYGILAWAQGENLLLDLDTHIGCAFVAEVLLLLLLAVISATGIVQEKESDTWSLLLATPLSPRAIVWGKFAGTLSKLKWPTLLIAAHFIIFTVFGPITWPSLLAVLWILITFNVLWVATGLYFSMVSRRVTTAVIFNLFSMALFYLLPLTILAIFDTMRQPPTDYAERVLWYMPFQYLATGLTAFKDRGGFELPGVTLAATRPQAMADWIAAVCGVGMAYLVLTFVIVNLIITRFDARVGRARQRKW